MADEEAPEADDRAEEAASEGLVEAAAVVAVGKVDEASDAVAAAVAEEFSKEAVD
jgi:hypothetical protein